MLSIQAPQLTLAQRILGDNPSLITNVLLAIAGTLVLWASAKIHIPFYPVPMTMQTFVVLVIGATYGWRLGGATVLLYLAEGAMGLPVFSDTPERGIGLIYMTGPTGGYLLGFVAAAVTVGWLAERGWDRNVFTLIVAMTIGTTLIFSCGLVWLGTFIGWDKPVFALGLTPFIYGAILKIALAGATLPIAWKITHRKTK